MKKIVVLLLLPAGLLISGCKKTPIASISADKKSIMMGETVTFTSAATNSTKTTWDFGDGATAEGESASHPYASTGVFLVTATSYSKKDKKWDKASLLITVKGRYLTKIVLTGFPSKKSSGSDWDGSSFGSTIEPEVFISLKLAGTDWKLETPYLDSAIPAEIPYTWDYTPDNIFLADASWTVDMIDDDRVGGVGGTESIDTWTSNLATATASGNKITLTNTTNTSGNAVVELHFIEK